jgi:phosphoserine aminotransferase
MDMTGSRPAVRPARPFFSSGPCAKRPGWTLDVLANALTGRAHRSKAGKARLKEAIDRTRKILGVPAAHRIAIVPASDTGAVEMALWSLLGPRPVDCLAWDSFGEDWIADTVKQLKLDARVIRAPYGGLPDLAQVDRTHDLVFVWNGTTSGVRVPDGEWIAGDREGLTICDATSAAFAMELPWDKLDAVAFSWQKVLGGEAAHGMLVLSPAAVTRLESYSPPWPLPKIFRMTKDGKLIEGLFEGETLNTPSMLAVEDYLDTLKWAESIDGLPALIARTRANFTVIERWVAETEWTEFLAGDPATRSTTSVCLKIVDPRFAGMGEEPQRALVQKIAGLLDKEGVAHDIAGHRNAPPSIRIWCGATVERADIEALTPWLDWAFAQVGAE